MWNRFLIPNQLSAVTLLLMGSLVMSHAILTITPSGAQTTPGGLGRDRSLPSQTFFEDGLDQLEHEIQILQQRENSNTAILTIQQGIQLSPYEIERLTDDANVEIQPSSEDAEEVNTSTEESR